jgi:hypothetical protein
LARKASATKYLSQFEAYLKLSLKAQSQCRATIEALAEIKNPKQVAFVQQVNIANGPQQVNTVVWHLPSPRARENLRISKRNFWGRSMANGWTLGTPSQAGGSDPAMATVGTVSGSENVGG